MDLRRQRAAHVAEVPGLVLVAGQSRAPALRIAQHPAIAPAVAGKPGPRPGPAPVPVRPGCGSAGGLEVDGRTQLVLRVARPCGRKQRPPVAHDAHPAPEDRDLRAVAPVRRLDGERRSRRPRGSSHRGEVAQGDAPNPPVPGHPSPRDPDQVSWDIGPGQAKSGVEQAAVPVRCRPIPRERVAHRAGRRDDRLRGPGHLARGQHEHAGQHGEQETAVRRGDTHTPKPTNPSSAGYSPIGWFSSWGGRRRQAAGRAWRPRGSPHRRATPGHRMAVPGARRRAPRR